MQALLFLSPALMDWMVFFVLFAVFYAAGIRGASTQECAWLGILFQITYMLSSFITGHFVTQRNARKFLFTSTIICGIMSVFVLNSSTFLFLAIELLLFGTACAMFFNSFQAFMRGEASVGSLKTNVAVYTLAWCMGAAIGNVTAGWLYQWGVIALILAVVFSTAVVLFMLTRPTSQSPIHHNAEEPIEQGSLAKYPVNNAYILVGWLMIFTVTFVQRPLFTFLPQMFALEGISSLWASLPLFMHMFFSAIFGLWMCRFRDSLYRRTPFCIIQFCGVAALIAMWLWPTYWICLSMMCLLGIYSAYTYYSAVYYAGNSGRRSFNIGVNEALVGFGSIAGIFLGDAWISHSGSTTSVYLVCALGLGLSNIAQLAVVIIQSNKPDMCPTSTATPATVSES